MEMGRRNRMEMSCATCKYNYTNIYKNIKLYYAYRAISKDKCCKFYGFKDRKNKIISEK